MSYLESLTGPKSANGYCSPPDGLRVVAPPNLLTRINHNGKYNRPVLTGEELANLPLLGHLLIDKEESVEHPDSRNNVQFGRLSQAEGGDVQVAIKQQSLPVVMGEIAMMQLCQSYGIRTLEPVGLGVDGSLSVTGKQGYLVSRYDPVVRNSTMDLVEWEELAPEDRLAIVDGGFSAIAELHAVGIVHGDSYTRNIVAGKPPKIFDLEHATSVFGNTNNGGSQPTVVRNFKADVWRLATDLMPEVGEEVLLNGLNSYRSRIANSDNAVLKRSGVVAAHLVAAELELV